MDPISFLQARALRSPRLSHLPPPPAGPLAWAGLAVSAALLAATVVATHLAMRWVMDIGGSCASGGPYVVETACPDGAAAILSVSLPLGMLAAGAFAASGWRVGRGVAALAVLAWPALFGALGWNFLEYGAIAPPAGEGVVWGWVLCGVLFGLIAAPVLAFVPRMVRAIEARRAVVLAVVGDAALAGAVGGWLLARALA